MYNLLVKYVYIVLVLMHFLSSKHETAELPGLSCPKPHPVPAYLDMMQYFLKV